MVDSQGDAMSGPVGLRLVVGGVERGDWPVGLVQVRLLLNGPSAALIELHEPAIAEGAGLLSDPSWLVSGTPVEVFLGHGEDVSLLFSGSLAKCGLSLHEDMYQIALDCTGERSADAGAQAAQALDATLGENILQYEAEFRGAGRLIVPGNALAMPGGVLRLRGVSPAFDGDFPITAVTQEVSDGDWYTEVKYGQEQRANVAPADGVVFERDGFRLTLDGESGCSLQDARGNLVKLGSGGISLQSSEDVSIQASGQVTIAGLQGVSLGASGGNLTLAGLNVTARADASLVVQGAATAKLTSTGETIIQGALVHIN